MAPGTSEHNPDESIVKQVILHDIGDLQAPIRGMKPNHVQIESGRFHGQILKFSLGSITLNVGEYLAPLRTADGAFSKETVTLVFSLLDTPENVMNGFELVRDRLLVFPEGCDHNFRMRGKMKWLVVEVTVQEINKFAEVLHRLELGTLGVHAWGLSLHPRRQLRFRKAISDLLHTSSTNPVWFEKEHNQKRLHEIFMDALAKSFLSSESRATISPDPRRINTRWIFKSAEEYIRSHSIEDISIADLCSVTHSSKSTLYRAFQDQIGLSPHELLIKRRLTNARRLLRSSSKESTTVATIAVESGWAHLGRFSACYKKLFGEYPSETLGREGR
jgi:AraC-like DNA-binding protein